MTVPAHIWTQNAQDRAELGEAIVAKAVGAVTSFSVEYDELTLVGPAERPKPTDAS